MPDGVDSTRSAVAAGSHLDSVTAGGIFDGVLGVYAALEVIRAMKAAGVTPDRPLEVVVFTEEEGGRFLDGVLGSSVAIGEQSIENALALTDTDSVSLDDALEQITGLQSAAESAERDVAERGGPRAIIGISVIIGIGHISSDESISASIIE